MYEFHHLEMSEQWPQIQKKPTYKNLGFFKLASIGSYIHGIYCEIRLPRFLIRLLNFVKKKQLVLMGDLYIESFTVE